MHRPCFYLAAFISLMTASVAALAAPTAPPVTAGAPGPDWETTANAGGFYIDLPAALTADQLIDRIKACRAALGHREEEITRYIDEHQLGAKDTLITIILPGGLLYAAIRTSDLEQAKTELAEVTEDRDALARDLLAMQAIAGELTVARLE